jgi:predicted acetyltransferase
MTKFRATSAANVEVNPASPEQRPLLANMLELYLHDFSEFLELRLGADGRFGYDQLPLYWKESGRHPFLIVADGHLAGLAFVRRGSQISSDADVWDLAEFFIVRGFRRLGLGMKAAQTVWKRFPGKWEVRVIDRNQKAMEFWPRAINEFLDRPIEPIPFDRNGEGWHVFSFESRRAV